MGRGDSNVRYPGGPIREMPNGYPSFRSPGTLTCGNPVRPATHVSRRARFRNPPISAAVASKRSGAPGVVGNATVLFDSNIAGVTLIGPELAAALVNVPADLQTQWADHIVRLALVAISSDGAKEPATETLRHARPSQKPIDVACLERRWCARTSGDLRPSKFGRTSDLHEKSRTGETCPFRWSAPHRHVARARQAGDASKDRTAVEWNPELLPAGGRAPQPAHSQGPRDVLVLHADEQAYSSGHAKNPRVLCACTAPCGDGECPRTFPGCGPTASRRCGAASFHGTCRRAAISFFRDAERTVHAVAAHEDLHCVGALQGAKTEQLRRRGVS
jgi:hypothetical protein